MAPDQQYQMPPETDTVGFTTRQLVEYDSCIASANDPTYGDDPIHVRSYNAAGSGTVTFDVFQVYKESEIGWVAVDYIDSTGTETCRKVDSIAHVFDERMKGFTAQCVNGQAEVWIHIHDGSKSIGQADMVCKKNKDPICPIPDHTDMIPARCNPSQNIMANNKCHFRYVIDCNAVFASAGRRRLQSIEGPGPGLGPGLQLQPGGPSPPAIVTPVETEKGRVLVKEGLPLFGSSVFKECTHRRTKRADGKVIYNNYKFGNGIQNAGLNLDGGGANGNERGLRGQVRGQNHNLEVIDI